MQQLRIEIRTHLATGHLVASCKDVPGLNAHGATLEQLKTRIREVLAFLSARNGRDIRSLDFVEPNDAQTGFTLGY